MRTGRGFDIQSEILDQPFCNKRGDNVGNNAHTCIPPYKMIGVNNRLFSP